MAGRKVVVIDTDAPELSDIEIGEGADIQRLLNISEFSGRNTKKAAGDLLIRIKDKIIEVQFEQYTNIRKCRDFEKKLREHPSFVALKNLKALIKKNQKTINTLADLYQGGFQMAKAAGIKMDPGVLNALKEATKKEG